MSALLGAPIAVERTGGFERAIDLIQKPGEQLSRARAMDLVARASLF